jgi:hypothetical protein
MTDRSICGLAAGEEAPNDLLEAEFSGQNAKANIVGALVPYEKVGNHCR